jgi:2-dehydro-3-deoxygluconokinase
MKKHPDALVLAGTVMTPEQAGAAIEAGAASIVSADYIPRVVDICVKHDVMCIPGGLSDAGKQLVQKSEAYGCALDTLKKKYPYQWIYKLFPAVVGTRSNAEIARAWQGPYKGLTVVYTGGVTTYNLRELVRHDPDGIFCGSAMTRSVDDPAAMRKEVEEWVNIVTGREEKKETIKKSSIKKNKAPKKIVTFGEIMLRLSPPDHQRFVQAGTYDTTFGGAEANVATALANYGLDSCFVTALPDHEIGQVAVNLLRSFGVDTRYILRQGKRVGIYFLEHGASQRPSKVIYDRAGSSISEIRTGQIDWETVFRDASWFHWSGITPALSDSTAEVVEEALRTAKKIGLTISVDLNYRKKLWSREKAQSMMSRLMPMVDICIGNEEDAECMFGITACGTDVESGQLDIRGYEEVARQMVKRFGFKKAALTLRESLNASENGWSACLYNGKEFLHSKKYNIHIVDRVGGGDSFSSGLIYALMTGKTDRDALEFGAAASCLKQTIPGDFNLVSVQEVEQLAKGKGSGRVQR